MVVLGMDIKDPELPPPTLNLGHQKEQARLDKEDRERQAREREARGAIEALLDKRDEEAKLQRIRQREAMAAAFSGGDLRPARFTSKRAHFIRFFPLAAAVNVKC